MFEPCLCLAHQKSINIQAHLLLSWSASSSSPSTSNRSYKCLANSWKFHFIVYFLKWLLIWSDIFEGYIDILTSTRKLTWSLNSVSISVMLFPLLTRIVHSLKFLRAVSRFWCSAAVLDSFVILRIGILSLSNLLFLCPFTPLFLYYSFEKNIG